MIRRVLTLAALVALTACSANDPAAPYLGEWHRPGQPYSRLVVVQVGDAYLVQQENPPAWRGRESTMTDHPSTFVEGALMIGGMTKAVHDSTADQLVVATFGGSVRYSRASNND